MYWGAAMDACTWNPAEHGALKVAHHGSKDAEYSDLIAAAETARSWVVTPWHSGRHLPNLADGHGPDLLLRSNPELLITSLTREASEFTSPVARTELEAAWVKIELANGKSTTRTRQPEIAESWVLASFTADGSAKIESGAETVTLVL
jgi:hypothetical protein